jgi:hypothetical protein
VPQRRDWQEQAFHAELVELIWLGAKSAEFAAEFGLAAVRAERIVGTGEAWLTELSVADLRAVLALSPDAVSA